MMVMRQWDAITRVWGQHKEDVEVVVAIVALAQVKTDVVLDA